MHARKYISSLSLQDKSSSRPLNETEIEREVVPSDELLHADVSSISCCLVLNIFFAFLAVGLNLSFFSFI